MFIFIAILSLTYIFPCNIGPGTNSQSKIFNQLIENVTEVELQRLKTSNQLQKGIPWGTFNHLVFALGIGYAAAMAVQTGIRRRWKRLPQYKADVATGIKKKEISGGSVSSYLSSTVSPSTSSLEITTEDSMSSQKVPINVVSIAVLKAIIS